MNSIATSKDPIIIMLSNCLLDCNPAALELFGFPDKERFLKCCPHELLFQQQQNGISAPQKMLYLFEQVHEEGVIKEVVIGRKEEGTPFVVDLQILSIAHDGGVQFYSKWVYRQQQDESPKILQDLVHQSKPPENKVFLHLNKEGKIIFASLGACSWLNYTSLDFNSNLYFTDLLAPSLVNSDKESGLPEWMVSKLAKKERLLTELTFYDSDKKEKVGQVNIKILPSHKQEQGYYKVVIKPVNFLDFDLLGSQNAMLEMASLRQENKNLKRGQKVIKKSLERFKVLADYSPDAIMQFDRSNRFLFVNPQVEPLTGFKADDFLGKMPIEVGFSAEFSKTCEGILNKVFKSGNNSRIDIMFPNQIWVDWFLIPEFDSQGEVITVITTARDITEQKHTQLKLQKSERKLSDAFEVTKLSSWEYDFQKDEVVLNSKFRKLIGLQGSEVIKLGGRDYFNQFVLKEDAAKFKNVLNAALVSCNEDFQEVLDYRICKPDGELVHILASVRLEIGEDGRIAKMYGTSQDITQLRLTEQELEKYRTGLERLVETRTQELGRSEAKLADALRLANLGTWEYDPVIDCFQVSNEVLEIVKTTAEIEGGSTITANRSREIIHPDDYGNYRDAVIRARDSADENYTEHTEFRLVRSDGQIRFIHLSIKTNRQGKYLKFYGTLQDITDIRHTESEKDRLNAIIEATSDMVAIVHPDGHMIYMNKAGRNFFGLPEEEEIQKRTFQSFQSLRSSKRLSRKEFNQADACGTWSGENQFMRFDGVEVPVSQVIVSHKNNEDQVECYSTIIRDISQQKRIEQDLIFKNNELDTFVYRASHDLRGPIATLMGLYNLVQYEIQEEPSLRLFDMYNSQVMRLNTITLTLIELTKIKEREFEPSAVDFRKIVRSIYGKLQGMTESQGMLFEQDIEKIEKFISDERLLLVILQNMVENSIKYKRQDTNSFVRVEVKKIKESGRVLIKVSDNGIGVESGIQHKIFNMFFRGSERSSGSGLGLYMLKNAVEKLGGRVTLYSVLYKGTTFKIELPPLKKELSTVKKKV